MVKTAAIPFNRPTLVGEEFARMREAIAGGHISGDGPFTHRCETALEEELGVARVLLTTSCTHALELAALLLGVGAGDEIVVPSFTFVSTAGAFALRGARIVFADVRADTLNLDEKAVDALVTPRTRAIVPVHYAGVGCEMDALAAIADRVGAAIVEDAAHGLFGRYRGRYLGTLGSLATLSFHETKNFSCGEGGALLVNDPALVDRAEILREKGTDRRRFFRGLVDKYTWVDLGSSYVISDLLAAFLSAQLDAREAVLAARGRVWHRYESELAGWAAQLGARLPLVPPDRVQAYHMFYVVLPSPALRDGLIVHLRERGILAVFHYVPLHLSAMGRGHGGCPGLCPVAEEVSERLVRLPFFTDMTDGEQERVIDAVLAFPP